MTNSKLGHYEIKSELGSGGMGVVYRARDEKLDRQVALKMVRDDLREDRELMARFQREARTLASLNHPHIASIHGIEELGGKTFLVLELVEGETLAERLKRKAMPMREALQVCRQIAEAIEAAHQRQIIHRDLKPANIKFTAEGAVKVLDFGLAKSLRRSTSTEEDVTQTVSVAATQPGMIVGTAPYMSPEQVRGEEPDTRSDIWAFGCILYEV
jgi:serine/threonine protein kinase